MPTSAPGRSIRLILLTLVLTGMTAPGVKAQTLQLSPSDILKRAVPGAPATPQKTAAAPPAEKPAAKAAPEEPPGPVAQAYLYLEPGQARFETLFDAASLLRMLDEKAELPATLDEATRQRLFKALAERTGAWCQIRESGAPLQSTQPYPSVLTGKPGATLPAEPEREPPLDEAMIGLAWLFELPPEPKVIETGWQGFLPASGKLPLLVFFGPKTQPATLTSQKPVFTWHNQGRLPRPPPLTPVPEAAAGSGWRLPFGFVLWALAGGALWAAARKRRGHHHHRLPGGTALYLIIWGASAVLLWPRFFVPLPGGGGSAHSVSTPGQAALILEPLLLNAYRAFDQRSESGIYDVLARSVEGELLRRLYLETIEALSLDGREGARVTVKEFSAEVDQVSPVPEGFTADCQWTALGTVGHWGHTHTRVNRYTARVTVSAVGNAWKMTSLEVLDAKRL